MSEKNIGEIVFNARPWSSGHMAPSNGLHGLEITGMQFKGGGQVEISTLNGKFNPYYQIIGGQGSVCLPGEFKGEGMLTEQEGYYQVRHMKLQLSGGEGEQ